MQDNFLRFDGLNSPIRVVGCESLLNDLSLYFPAWTYHISAPDDQAPFATLIGNDHRFHLSAIDKAPSIHTTAVNAVCDLIAVIAQQIPRENPDQLCLHAASAKIGKGLIVFPATRRAGKSTLMAALASKGVALFGDDILPVTTVPGQPLFGLAGGVALRLRKPLPPEVPTSLLTYLNANPGPENRQYRYVPSAEIISHGEQSPITAFVHLERAENGSTRLEPLSRGKMLKSLMKQNFARDGTAQHILSALFSLAKNTSSWVLTYSNLDEAAEVLLERFENSSPNRFLAEIVSNPAEITIDSSPIDPAKQLNRHPEASVEVLDGEAFVATRDMTRIMHANEGAQRVWALLEEPTSPAEAVEIICAAFPDADASTIEQETQTVFEQFKACGLTAFAD